MLAARICLAKGYDGAVLASYGMIHGRFQPFHRGHAAYLGAAADLCETLVVGITNPDAASRQPVPSDEHRHLPEANPFSYFERLQMVRRAARDVGVDDRRLEIVPFPIHQPDLWADYVRPQSLMIMRILSPWGETKRQLLERHGFTVHLLDDERDARITGTDVRAALAGDGDWRELVTPGVADLLDAFCSREAAS